MVYLAQLVHELHKTKPFLITVFTLNVHLTILVLVVE